MATSLAPGAFRAMGPCPSPLMVVGEAPTKADAEDGRPFSGATGDLLTEFMYKAGLVRGMAFLTHVIRTAPPRGDPELLFPKLVRDRTLDTRMVKGKYVLPAVQEGLARLEWEIAEVRPTLVIACGNVALWALTGHWGVRKWRGSVLQGEVAGHKFKVLVTINPAKIWQDWALRPLFQQDLRRAKGHLASGPIVNWEPKNYLIRPTFAQAVAALENLRDRLSASNSLLKLAGDIETRAGHIACLGIAWSRTEAICVPFMCVEKLAGYWTAEEEFHLIELFQAILTHSNAYIIGQNWNYDRQYIYRWHHYMPKLGNDTMVTHHAMFSYSEKGLGHLSSLYCDEHVFWKDDGRLWDPSQPEDDYWVYNCDDCTRTFDIDEGEHQAITQLVPAWKKLPAVTAFQTRLQDAVLRMMLRGVRSNEVERARLSIQLRTRLAELEAEVTEIAGQPLNVKSTTQMPDFFYNQLQLTPITKRRPDGTRSVTTDDEALETIAGKEPVLRPLIHRIQAIRSGGVFLSTFLEMRRDVDGRVRCSYNTAGTVTYRFSSSRNAFDSGGNLQNVPVGDEDEPLRKDDPEGLMLPNVRKLFIPDFGYTMFDLDGDSADLRIVTWESNCLQMKAYFAAKAKPYVEIAKEFYHDQTITKHHPSYKRMKALCHGTNYGGEAFGLSERIGLPVHDIDRMQKWYFGMCPEIKAWQDDIRAQVRTRGWIENPFGYRMYFQDRYSDKLANEALAWTPQSSVGILINHALVNIDEQLPWCQLLLQVHDSLNGQFPVHMGENAKAEILRAATVPIQCQSGELVIPMGLKTSNVSWGDCE